MIQKVTLVRSTLLSRIPNQTTIESSSEVEQRLNTVCEGSNPSLIIPFKGSSTGRAVVIPPVVGSSPTLNIKTLVSRYYQCLINASGE